MWNSNNKAKPFLKWAGGKGQLLEQLSAHLPNILQHEEFNYIEPFVGGGAMLFFMLQNFNNIKSVTINDINSNLTQSYIVVRDNADLLVELLKCTEKEYISLNSEEARKDFYLSIRSKFNTEDLNPTVKTSLLIFLNRTCFNGLYRENSKGLFNVPFGRYSNPTICNDDLIFADSELLNHFKVKVTTGDFKQTISAIDSNSLNFFYFDPPYRPLSATSSFNSYVKEAFNDECQRELANFCKDISSQENVLWMLSNSDCSSKNPKDLFFEQLYYDFIITRVNAKRSINANANKRGVLTELLIMNYSLNHSLNEKSA